MGKKPQVALKTPKGTKDWEGTDMVIREKIFSAITNVFRRHGAVTLETPVFELKEILTGKYGEDSKLIYDLQDQGGELCSLRYDLTVPFARWMAMTGTQSIKRYAIAKVYRRDQPAMAKGRLREFMQCDFDIAGSFDTMLPDAEIFRIICEVFHDLQFGQNFTIKTNHRAILDGIFAACGVPEDRIRTISSAVDKLDKSPWEEVKKEMVEEKGLSEEIAEQIWKHVQKKGGKEVLEYLQNEESLKSNERVAKGVEEMSLLYQYLEAFDILDRVEFNLHLARGLDYYTGVIYEVTTFGSAPPAPAAASGAHDAKPKRNKATSVDDDRSDDPTVGVGSIAAGGRYDGLVGRFSGKNVPCVGISFGVERIFSVTKARIEADKAAAVRRTEVDVFVMALGFGSSFTGLLKERMQVCKILWDAGIKATFAYKNKPKLPAQFKAADDEGIPFAVILGEEEQAKGVVKVKEMGLPDGHPEKDGVPVELTELATEIKKRLVLKAAKESEVLDVGGASVSVEGVTDKTGDLNVGNET